MAQQNTKQPSTSWPHGVRVHNLGPRPNPRTLGAGAYTHEFRARVLLGRANNAIENCCVLPVATCLARIT